MASSLNNGAYIGILIAVYVLNDARCCSHPGVPLGFFTLMFFVLAGSGWIGAAPVAAWCCEGRVRNPMAAAAACGFLLRGGVADADAPRC